MKHMELLRHLHLMTTMIKNARMPGNLWYLEAQEQVGNLEVGIRHIK